jgi:hypothetical protein
MSCPKCNEKSLQPFVYDHMGCVAEIVCQSCGYRECKWCHKELQGNERAVFECKGNFHRRVVEL